MNTKTGTKHGKNVAMNNTQSTGFSQEEKDAMKARAKELKAEERMNKNKAEGEKAALDAIHAMEEPDRSLAMRVHEIVKSNGPSLMAKTWYGMPAYADKEGKVICYFQSAQKFQARYATFGFNDRAALDEGNMWAVSFAILKLTAAEEEKIAALVKKAVQ